MGYGGFTRRLVLVIAGAGLLSPPFLAHATGPFEQKLTKEQRITQALSRLTFGARPEDTEEVRRLGVEKWIELQLHPEPIPENPVLEMRLAPLERCDLMPPRSSKNTRRFRPV